MGKLRVNDLNSCIDDKTIKSTNGEHPQSLDRFTGERASPGTVLEVVWVKSDSDIDELGGSS